MVRTDMVTRFHTADFSALFPFLLSRQYHLAPATKGDHKGRPCIAFIDRPTP